MTKPYIHKVQYYETDKMGITHHSNYIRWMEEARADWMEQVGFSYTKMEEMGVFSPVVNIECNFVNTTTFNDEVEIEVKMIAYTGVRLVVEYIMKKQDNIVLTGKSTHCFLNSNYRPVRLKQVCPQFDEILNNLLNK